MSHPSVSALALLLAWSTAAPAAERIDYVRAVKTILAARCYACHGALQQKAGLRLDTVLLVKKGGDSGPAIVAGQAGKSRLLDHVTAANGARRMPPASRKDGSAAARVTSMRPMRPAAPAIRTGTGCVLIGWCGCRPT